MSAKKTSTTKGRARRARHVVVPTAHALAKVRALKAAASSFSVAHKRRDLHTKALILLNKMLSLKSLEPVMVGILTRAAGHPVTAESSAAWLNAFEWQDITELVGEIVECVTGVNSERVSARILDDVIHEWQESALALSNAELQNELEAEPEAIPIDRPPLK